ncbi:MAG: tRNA epoxyqueuosine(34) reductase QueG [Solirubrobacteraceae bacterium]
MILKEKNTELIKSKALEFGFISCGISKAEFLEEEAPKLENWLKNNFHADMSYMENNFDKRLNPKLLIEGSKSVISLIYNYYTTEKQANNTYKIAKYAYGDDYHVVIKNKLKELVKVLQNEIGEFSVRIFVDSAPILERAWAKKSGLGWIGKNTNLLTKKLGSFYFIAEIITDLNLIYDNPTKDHCGSCSACIDACPTKAFVAPYILDSSKCISYLTIENKNEIPSEFKNKLEDWIFGCDICQEVCPWNKFSLQHKDESFKINEIIKTYNKKDWEEIEEETFKIYFKNSAIKRTKFKGLKKNIKILLN